MRCATGTRSPTTSGLTTVAGLPHPLAEQPGLEPAPQLSPTKMVDEAMTQWFLRHLTTP
ncbi:MAG TPA: hypothetical protein VE645_15535 [Pseudonocardiaceae bacterium]|nr:hypothetical protein [Pseudonocardiaceae bacterium]